METSVISQADAGTQRKKTNIRTFLNEFDKKCQEIGTSPLEKVNQKTLDDIRSIYCSLIDSCKQAKILDFIIFHDEADKGELMKKYVNAWFSQLRVLEKDVNIVRMAMIKNILLYLFVARTEDSLISLYHTFSLQIVNCTEAAIKQLILHDVTEKVSEDMKPIRKWRDCILLLINFFLPREERNSKNATHQKFVDSLLLKWLQKSRSEVIFRHIVSIISALEVTPLFIDFTTNNVLEELALDGHKKVVTMKAIILMEVVDIKLVNRLLRSLIHVWPVSDDGPSDDLLESLQIAEKVFRDNSEVAKNFISIFKHDKGLVFHSSFGFLSILILCGMDRYRTFAVDVKRILQKLWKFEEEMKEYGIIDTSKLTAKIVVESQVKSIVSKLNESCVYKLFGSTIFTLAQSLLDGSSHKKVVIVDGRVGDCVGIWQFAKSVITACFFCDHASISTHLTQLMHSIASSSASGAALVFIDILLDVVKKRSVELLNNWKLINDLFEYVCRMRRDVAVSLIRCLLPIITNRPQLRTALFKNLKKDLIDNSTVAAAVPILILLLRSVSKKRATPVEEGNLSQAFGSFSTQGLHDMGLKRTTDDSLSLEIVGILKRCLCQSAKSKAALYRGVSDSLVKCPALIAPFTELLATHATSIKSWLPKDMVAASQYDCFLREPLPQLVQTLDQLMCESLTSSDKTATQASDGILEKVTNLLNKWVTDACYKDTHDLSIDKVSEWDPTTTEGKQTLIFAHMMNSLYDALIEHVYKRVHNLNEPAEIDHLIAIINKKKQLMVIMDEKIVKRKEVKATGRSSADAKVVLNYSDGMVKIRLDTIALILNALVDTAEDESQLEYRESLLIWGVEKAMDISQDYLNQSDPTTVVPVNLVIVAKKLFSFYSNTDCPSWMEEVAISGECKTNAIEAYCNFMCFLCNKYANAPAKISNLLMMDEEQTQENKDKSKEVNKNIVKHVHQLVAKCLLHVIEADRARESDTNKKKKTTVLSFYERQVKALIKVSNAFLSVTTNPRAYSTAFSFTFKLMEKNVFENGIILKDVLKFAETLTMKTRDNDKIVVPQLLILTNDILDLLVDPDLPLKMSCVDEFSLTSLCNFLMDTTEKLMKAMSSIVGFAQEFYVKDVSINGLVTGVIAKFDEYLPIVAKVLTFYTEHGLVKEKVAQFLTSVFTAIESPVILLLSNCKHLPEMTEWSSIDKLSTLLNEKLQDIMALADQKVGLLSTDEIMNTKSKKTQAARAKRDETTYVKYVRARESLQTRVLLLCQALKDDRLDFQVKGNSIGVRDFRIDSNILMSRMAENMQNMDDNNSEAQVPKTKRRKKNNVTQDDQEEMDSTI